MLTIRPSEMEIIQSLKQPLIFRRADQIDEYDADDDTTYTTLSPMAEAALIPSERPQTILPTGEVIVEPDFQCIMLEPLVDINVGTEADPIITQLEQGDIVIAEDGSTLFVDSIFHPKNTQVMMLGLQRQQ